VSGQIRETTWRPVWGTRPRTIHDAVMLNDALGNAATVSCIVGWEQVERYVTEWTPVDPQPDEMEVGEGPGTIKAKIEASSLGTPEARALRATVSDEHAARIVARAREMETEACCDNCPSVPAPDRASHQGEPGEGGSDA